MTSDHWNSVDRRLAALLIGADADLDSALEANADAGLPPIDVSPLQGKLLQILVQLMKASAVLELGTLGGYSTIWLARGLASDGRLVSLELDPHHAATARANLERARLADRVELRVGPALESLQALVREGGRGRST